MILFNQPPRTQTRVYLFPSLTKTKKNLRLKDFFFFFFFFTFEKLSQALIFFVSNSDKLYCSLYVISASHIHPPVRILI